MLLNFQPQFVDPIQQGSKRHTLRAPRKDETVPAEGELLHLYSGLRRPGARRIVPPTPCVRVDGAVLRDNEEFEVWVGPFDIRFREPFHSGAVLFYPEHYGLTRLAGDEVARFAEADGFSTFDAFCTHWRAEFAKRRFKLERLRGLHGRTAVKSVYLNLIHWGLVRGLTLPPGASMLTAEGR